MRRHTPKTKKKRGSKRISSGFRRIGRRFRGIIRKCDSCGKRGQELFKMYSFGKNGSTKKRYMCKKCYSKIFIRKEREP